MVGFPLWVNGDVVYQGQHGSVPGLTLLSPKGLVSGGRDKHTVKTPEKTQLSLLGGIAWSQKYAYFTIVKNYKQNSWLQSINHSNIQSSESNQGISAS